MSIPLPSKLEIKEQKDNRAEVVIEPCYPGFGVTLGNALRRVLLSSLEGTAITAFKINGAMHEFSTLPNIKEDLVEIMSNLKRVRLKSFSNEPVILNLKVKGEKTVTAGDIGKNSDIEISNPDQIIATLTDKSAELDMEITVKKGKGYITVEERAKEKVDLGVIMIDSFYSPVVNVGFEVDNVRVGDITDYDKLVLKIETDGTLSPKEALEQSADILVEQFEFIKQQQEVPTKAEEKSAKAKVKAAAIGEEKEVQPDEEKAKKKRGRPKKNDKE